MQDLLNPEDILIKRESNSKALFLCKNQTKERRIFRMAFITSSISTLQTVVTAIGGGLAVWGVINLLEGYGNDNRATRSQVSA